MKNGGFATGLWFEQCRRIPRLENMYPDCISYCGIGLRRYGSIFMRDILLGIIQSAKLVQAVFLSLVIYHAKITNAPLSPPLLLLYSSMEAWLV